MTVCAAWIQRIGTTKSLALATDSRLSCGETWDACPKITVLPRNDSAICFAGSTLRTYPLMLQLVTSISSFPDSRRRILDFDDMKGHAIRVFNYMLSKVRHEVPSGEGDFKSELLKTTFLLCGYSWRKTRFRIVRISYCESRGVYVAHNHKVKERTFVFIGDVDTEARVDIAADAKSRLQTLLREKKKYVNQDGRIEGGYLEWEPFEVIRDMITCGEYRTIGGPPQVAKIYPHMNCQQFAVYWPSRVRGEMTIAGRPAMDYESTDWPRLDASTLEITMHSLQDTGRAKSSDANN